MNGLVDIPTIFFMALAVFVFIRLRSVLGRRTGNERPPPDPFSRGKGDREADKNVVELPRPSTGRAAEESVRENLTAFAGGAKSEGVAAIAAAEGAFDTAAFLGGAKRAYEAIVTAFATGDRKTLKQLLSREVYDGFLAAISEREERDESVDFKFIGIDKAEITDAAVRSRSAQVTVRFVSSLVSVTRGSEGKIVEGDPTQVSEVTDIWTFAREVKARDPNWRLVATESVE